MTRIKGLSLFISSMIAASGLAQSTTVVPLGAEIAAGGNGNSIPLGNFASGTYQVLYSADQVASIPAGSVITGMRLRLYNAATTNFPASAKTVGKFDVRMASSINSPGSMSTNFSTNMLSPVLVRSGTLNLSANAYTADATGATPEAWGPLISFTTGYVYNGGPLVIEVRSENAATESGHFADDLLTNGKASFASATSSTQTTAGSVTSNRGLVVQLTYTPPATDLAIGVTKVFMGENYAGAPAPSGQNSNIQTSERVMVSVASADQFDTIGPQSEFVGMSWRGWSTLTPWPAAPATFNSFLVQLSRSQNAPGSLSINIASNVGADAVPVRSGPLTIAPSFIATKGSESFAPFSEDIRFFKPYIYKGGPLLTVVRHTGQSSGSTTFLDSIAPGNSEYNQQVQSFRGYDQDGTHADEIANTEVTRFSVDAGTSSPLGSASPGGDPFGITIMPVMQTVIAASELRHIPVGSTIDSLWFRNISSSPARPFQNIASLNFEVAVSTAANRPEFMSNTVAENEGPDKVVVQSGAFSVLANTFPAGSNGNFGKLVQFRKNFVYKGGDLCVTIRHSGVNAPITGFEALFETASFNRTIYSANVGSTTGAFYDEPYTGTVMKFGYIPSVMTPNRLAEAEGVDGVEMPSGSSTVQAIIGADELRSIDIGSVITGLSLRRSSTGGGNSFPASDTTLAKFDITVGPAANGPTSSSPTFDANQGPDSVLVRSGPLTVPKHAYPATASSAIPGENAWYIDFSRPYVYTGGDLCITMRQEGVLTGSVFFDVDGYDVSPRGSMRFAHGFNATTGDLRSALAVRLAFTARNLCPCDLNNDGQVDDADFVLFVQAYNLLDCNDGAMPVGCPADFNFDRLVDDADFVTFVAAYNELVCP